MKSDTAPEFGAGSGPNRQLNILLWKGETTELSATVPALCTQSVLAFASVEISLPRAQLGETA
jgi:hypothetical protein